MQSQGHESRDGCGPETAVSAKVCLAGCVWKTYEVGGGVCGVYGAIVGLWVVAAIVVIGVWVVCSLLHGGCRAEVEVRDEAGRYRCRGIEPQLDTLYFFRP